MILAAHMLLWVGLAAGAPAPAAVRAEWGPYVATFIQSDGRVIDRAGDDVSTSEGQAYALVRAAWCDDRATFEQVLRWTRDNLQGGDPVRLPAWRWGRRADGTWGVLDANSASDADQWMAWALVLAADRWRVPAWHEQALGLLQRIWDEETEQAGPRRVLLPGRWEKGKEILTLNPSYWLPFAWRTFARVDPTRDWTSLIDAAYHLWEACRAPSGLPPDWCWVERASGRVVAPPKGEELKAGFGFEAFRIGWTLAAESRWYQDDRARRQLAPFTGLADRWSRERTIPAVIRPDGTPLHTWSYLGLYGALLPAWAEVRHAAAEDVFASELRAARPPASAHDYYAHNWVWFGLALWSGLAQPELR
jgi:endoglucanase